MALRRLSVLALLPLAAVTAHSSPAGSPPPQLAFFERDHGGGTYLDILTLRAKPGKRPILSRSPRLNITISDHVTWSPDGRRLAFSTTVAAGIERIAIVQIATRRTRFLTHANTADLFPAWSPDGKWIAFARRPDRGDANSDIWLIRPDGTGLRRVTHDPEDNDAPTWRADGSLSFGPGIVTARPDGSGSRVVDTGCHEAAWSPDGDRVACIVYAHRGAYVVVKRPGGRPRALTPPTELQNESYPAWSPDGRWIAFTRTLGRTDVWVAHPDATGLRSLTRHVAIDSATHAAWRP